MFGHTLQIPKDAPYPYIGSVAEILTYEEVAVGGAPQAEPAYRSHWEVRAANKDGPTYPIPTPESRGMCVRLTRVREEPVVETDPLKGIDQFVVRMPDLSGTEVSGPAAQPDHVRPANIARFTPELERERSLIRELWDGKERYGIVPALVGDSADGQELPKCFDKDGAFPVLFREYVDGDNLANYWKCCSVGFDGQKRLDKWFEIFDSLLDLVHTLHLKGQPHGYICPSNIIVRNLKGGKPNDRVTLCLVNFERELPDPELHPPPGVNLGIHRWRRPYDSPDKVYAKGAGNAPGLFDPFVTGDIFSLGLTMLFLATNQLIGPFDQEDNGRPWVKIISNAVKSGTRIKREVMTLVEKSPMVEAVQDPVAVLVMTEALFACLRVGRGRFHNARTVKEVLESFRRVRASGIGVSSVSSSTAGVLQALLALESAIEADVGCTPLARLYIDRLRHQMRPFVELEAGKGGTVPPRYTVGPGREVMVEAVLNLLLNWERGTSPHERVPHKSVPDIFGMTSPAFFYDENFGSGGRVISALRIAALRGARIQWLFVTDEARLNDVQVQKVMEKQAESVKWVKRAKRENKGTYDVRYVDHSGTTYRKYLREHRSGMCLLGPGLDTIAIPDYSEESGAVIALRVYAGLARALDLYSRNLEEFGRAHAADKFPHRSP